MVGTTVGVGVGLGVGVGVLVGIGVGLVTVFFTRVFAVGYTICGGVVGSGWLSVAAEHT